MPDSLSAIRAREAQGYAVEGHGQACADVRWLLDVIDDARAALDLLTVIDSDGRLGYRSQGGLPMAMPSKAERAARALLARLGDGGDDARQKDRTDA